MHNPHMAGVQIQQMHKPPLAKAQTESHTIAITNFTPEIADPHNVLVPPGLHLGLGRMVQ